MCSPALERAVALAGNNQASLTVMGTAGKEIPALARQIEADLIVMGTVARTGAAGFIIRNTAETILNQIECSVLTIKPPGFVTQVEIES